MIRAMRGASLTPFVFVTAVIIANLPNAQSAWAQGQSQLPSFIDERRLPQNGTDVSKDAQQDDSTKRQKAEEEERARQAAESARKAAEEEAARQEAARRKAEEERARQAAENARKAAEQEAARKEAARRKAEEERARQTPEPRRGSAADDLAQRMLSGGACKDVQLATQPQPAGRIEIKLHSSCLAGRPVTFTYAGHDFVRTLDNNGDLTFLLDLFEGAAPLALKFDDGSKTDINVSGVSLAQISKVAVLWSAPVNLDLHAFEYLAPKDGKGHVWAKAPASLETVMAEAKDGARGRGFLSTADTGEGAGTHVEVYTFLHNKNQRHGAVTLMIDYETRGAVPSGEHCGKGALAIIEALVVRMRPGGAVDKEIVRLGPAPCGDPLPDSKRFNSDTLGDLMVRG